MDLNLLRKKYKTQILQIAEECNVDNIRVFGSVARGESTKNSDIDFLVHMRPNSGLKFLSLQWKLEELLKIKVDVVEEEYLHHRIKDRILEEAVNL